MILFKHELKKGWKSLAIWTIAISFFLVVCVLIYPEMKGEMEKMNDMFSSMGAFTQAFGMDKINFGTWMGYYAIECGNVMGLGGAFFAAIIAITALAKEEKDRTAEFLLSHPISRRHIVTEKGIAVLVQICIMNAVVFILSVISMVCINVDIAWKEIVLLHFAYFLVQIVIAGICFGISAFVKGNGIGIGIGVAVSMYFINLVANITTAAKDLKYITPFGFADGASIVEEAILEWKMVVVNIIFALVGIIAAYVKYVKKDVR